MSKLLIIGAGDHGYVVKEIAQDVGCYEKIDFVDDRSKEAIGTISDLENLNKEYDSAFASIGNNELRSQIVDELKRIGYDIPVLIHPSAYVSKSCVLGVATVIEPNAVVNSNSYIGEGCIISVGAVVDHNATVGDFCQIDAGAVVCSGKRVESKTKINAGCVVKK